MPFDIRSRIGLELSGSDEETCSGFIYQHNYDFSELGQWIEPRIMKMKIITKDVREGVNDYAMKFKRGDVSIC